MTDISLRGELYHPYKYFLGIVRKNLGIRNLVYRAIRVETQFTIAFAI